MLLILLLVAQFICNRINQCSFVQITGSNFSTIHTDVFDMCSNISRISTDFYLITPVFPAKVSGTEICNCRAKPLDSNQLQFEALFKIEHLLLSSTEVCDEELLIYKNDELDGKIISKCSPSQLEPMSHSFKASSITFSFYHKVASNSSKKTGLWLGVQGKLQKYNPTPQYQSNAKKHSKTILSPRKLLQI